jgi:hypothetical protein
MAEAGARRLRQIKWAFSRLAANLVDRNLNFWNWRSLSFFAFAAIPPATERADLLKSCTAMVDRVWSKDKRSDH